MTIAEALGIYGAEHAPHTADPARIAYAITALLSWWADLPVAAITKETCRAYAKERVKPRRRDPETGEVLEWAPVAPGTIRRELGALAAALAYCKDEGPLLDPPKVLLPGKPEPRDRWLTRSEAARLLRAAWRNPEAKHLAQFILVALYTGSRKSTILRLRFMPNAAGGWVDTTRGVMYRRAQAQSETKKRQPTLTVPRPLLAHIRRWERHQRHWVVEFDGAGVASIKTAWGTAIAAAGLEGTGVTPHTLRHTAITWAMQSGRADAWELAGYFGVRPETMHRVYAHHHPDYQSGAIAAVTARGRKL